MNTSFWKNIAITTIASFLVVTIGVNSIRNILLSSGSYAFQNLQANAVDSARALQTLDLLGSLTTKTTTSQTIVGTPESAAPGVLDLTFSSGTGTPGGYIQSLAIQPDSKILMGVVGATTYNGVAINNFARANLSGSNDTTLVPTTGITGGVYGIIVQPDGKIVTAGTSANRVDRYKANGSIDTLFTPPVLNGSAMALSMDSGNRILVGGLFNKGIVRLNTDGTLDTTFAPTSGANGEVDAIAIQFDGKILIGGNFTTYNGMSRKRIARINTDGTLDTTFSPSLGVNNKVSSIAVQPDGKILVGGNFTGGIIRYNTNGSVDTTFTIGTGFGPAGYRVNSVVLESDGKSIIGGSFASYNGVARNNIARLNIDGTLDTSFDPGTGTNGEIYAMAFQNNGQKLIFAGAFTSFNGITRNNIARLTALQPSCIINSLDVAAPTGLTNFTVAWSTTNCVGLVLETNTGAQRQQYTVPVNGTATYSTTTTRSDLTLDVSLIASNLSSIASSTRSVTLGGIVPVNSQCGFTALSATPATVNPTTPSTTLAWSSPAGCQVALRAWTPGTLGSPVAVYIPTAATYFGATDSTMLTPLAPTAYSVTSQIGTIGVTRTAVVSARTIDVKKE